jgi:hypothetical protein
MASINMTKIHEILRIKGQSQSILVLWVCFVEMILKKVLKNASITNTVSMKDSQIVVTINVAPVRSIESSFLWDGSKKEIIR